jgi:hypothetical protein
VEERLWKAGVACHREGSPALAAWVDELRSVLYQRSGKAMVARWRQLRPPRSSRGPGTEKKRAVLDERIG